MDLGRVDVRFEEPPSDVDTGCLLLTLLGGVKFRLVIRCLLSFLSAVFDELAARGQLAHALIV